MEAAKITNQFSPTLGTSVATSVGAGGAALAFPLSIGVDSKTATPFSQELLASLGSEDKSLKSSLQDILATTEDISQQLTGQSNVAKKFNFSSDQFLVEKDFEGDVDFVNQTNELNPKLDALLRMPAERSLENFSTQSTQLAQPAQGVEEVNAVEENSIRTLTDILAPKNKEVEQAVPISKQQELQTAAAGQAKILPEKMESQILAGNDSADVKKIALPIESEHSIFARRSIGKGKNSELAGLTGKLRDNSVSKMGMNSYSKEQNLLKDNVINISGKRPSAIIANKESVASKIGEKQETSNILDFMAARPEASALAGTGLLYNSTMPVHGGNQMVAPKVLDLNSVKSSNVEEIIARITDYVDKNIVNARPTLDITVKHDSLGTFKVNATTGQGIGNGQVDLKITTNNEMGNDFFVRHESKLVQALNSAGIDLSTVKIVSGGELLANSGTSKGWDGASNSHNNSAGGDRGFSGNGSWKDESSFSQRQSEQNDSQRRKDLWEEFMNRKQA